LDRARKAPTHSLGLADDDPVEAAEQAAAEARADLERIQAEADENGDVLWVTLRALGRKTWADLVRQHPPRDGDDVPEEVRESDKQLGVNDESFGEAMLPLA